MEPSQFLLDEVAKHIVEADIGVIVAGRQLDPELREPVAQLARVAGFPILAEPTSQLRCGPHDRSYVVTAYDLLLRDEHFRDRFARSGPALRRMPTSKPLRSWLAESELTRSSSIRSATGTSRRAGRRRCSVPTRPSCFWLGARLGEERPAPAMWLEAERAAAAAIEASCRR